MDSLVQLGGYALATFAALSGGVIWLIARRKEAVLEGEERGANRERLGQVFARLDTIEERLGETLTLRDFSELIQPMVKKLDQLYLNLPHD